MNDRFADLHIHTYYSDSTASPLEVVEEAKAFGLSCISIADHDTVDAFPEACAAADKVGLEVLPGVELSSEHHGKDIHILGYLFGMEKTPLIDKLQEMQDVRQSRMKKMVAKLYDMGIKDIDFDEVCGMTHSDAVGRLHLAKMLVKKGHVRTLDDAFIQYLGEGAAAYFPKYGQTPFEAIDLIKRSGGVAVMAHPMLTQRDEIIPALVKAGLDGLEAYYPNCSMEVVNYYMGIAERRGLLVTGGSDAHGKAKTSTFIGKSYVSCEWVERLKARAQHAGC
ncbi:MAG: PHP domain-containing protein [Candidatus Omnitrophica bacterium]|nr:PHP domain-containing protein [Candidatus Omnitrophota bacterium]